ncbi:glycoside hydrolase N-terminal domain-containing protein [Microtetraspora sp. NBRC 16547]|uniref:glycosyl hydrolase family 95 catalytic domain-containing protein n=1 Tax=Microtetraspora sp. NBRC 16547 TaxID=3030993 RepID=UPI0025549404|nr:glycoside hydrolase N-terminal domain-containing protein [Microtetraspora sp. NBRC 16547]
MLVSSTVIAAPAMSQSASTLPALTVVTDASTQDADHSGMTLWYDEPATDWQSQSLPIGSGALGATIFGGVGTELLQFNEKTLWTGGPGSAQGYNFGNWKSPRPNAIQEVQDKINADKRVSPSWVASKLGQPKAGFGAYQTFGELRLTQLDAPSTVSDYRRALDIADAVASVTYRSDEVRYTREYFASAADDVIVARFIADKPGSISFITAITAPDNRSKSITAKDGQITLAGALKDNGLRFESQIQVLNIGGQRTDNDNGSVTVKDADEVVLLLAAGTDYSEKYPTYRTVDPHDAVTGRIDAAAAKSFDQLKAAHTADHRALFDRVRLDVGQQMPQIPTDDLLKGYRDGSASAEARKALEILYFQYGRYLLIASSRGGSLPANLQGVWNNSISPPWSADYHVNINLQMNYWPAETTNLSETTAPLFDYVDAMVAPGEVTAKEMFGNRGWVVQNETNPFGFTGVHDWDTAFWFPEAGAWLAQHYWEHYLFTRDEQFLRDRVYPMFKSLSQFWIDELVVDPRDGKLVVNPSYSPEQGDFSAGASMSQQIVWDLLTNTTEAAKIVGDTSEFTTELADTLARLDPGLRIGSWGQLQEWKEDWDNPKNTHRHVSHLFALFPGRQIAAANDPKYADAAAVSLRARGDGEAVGWSKAWKANFWARLLDGNNSYKNLSALLKSNTFTNLWDNCCGPFQIDGNFGATAGVAEMLLQSHAGTIDILPALPDFWRDGSVDGLRARGAFTVGVTWQSGSASSIRIASDKGGTAKLRSEMFNGKVFVYRSNGKPADYTVENGVLTLPTKAGEEYRIVAQATVAAATPDGARAPGSEVPVSVTLSAADRQVIPTTVTRLEVPDGWAVAPMTGRSMPLKPGKSTALDFTVTVPRDAADGSYQIAGVVSTDEWTVRAPARIDVLRENLALRKPAEQSSTYPSGGGVASRAVDGNTNGDFSNTSVTHTNLENQPWWQVDLGVSQDIGEILVWNRTDCCSERLSDFYVLVSDSPFTSASLETTMQQPGVHAFRYAGTAGTPTRINIGKSGRYVRVQLTASNYLALAEVQVFRP